MEDKSKLTDTEMTVRDEYIDDTFTDPDGQPSSAPTDKIVPLDTNDNDADSGIDYEELIRSDLELLSKEFTELSDIKSITELKDPIRYAALRDLGLDPVEAYLASSRRRGADNRSHLRSAYGKGISPSASQMPRSTLAEAREIFSGLSDTEIQQLYKKVTR